MIEFTFTPTFNDYWQLNRYVVGKTMRRLKWPCILSACAYVLMPWSLRHLSHQASVYTETPIFESYIRGLPILFIPGLVVFLFSVTFLSAKVRWKKAPELSCAQTYTIGDEGVSIKADAGDGSVSWRYIAYAELRDGWFFLKTGQNLFYYFPKSIVPDPKALAHLITSKVAKTEGLTHA
jgi:hypothetical protein